MALDLIGTKRLRGMNRVEVHELLGPSQPPAYPGGFAYYLCEEPGSVMVLDSCWLTLEIDHSGRVCDEEIVTD